MLSITTQFFRAAALLSVLCLAGCATWTGGTLLSTLSGNPHREEIAAAKKNLKNPVKTHLAYATWQERIGNTAEARESYEIVLGIQPNSVEAALGLARLDQMTGQVNRAEERYRALLKAHPTEVQVWQAWGQFLASQERWSEAVPALQRAVKGDPNNRAARYQLAVALARAGQPEEARPHFAQVIGDAEADYNIAVILYEQGHVDAAEQKLVQAVLKKPALQEAQQWLDELRRERQTAAATVPGSGRTNAADDLLNRIPAATPAFGGSSAPSPTAVVPELTAVPSVGTAQPANDAQPVNTAPPFPADVSGALPTGLSPAAALDGSSPAATLNSAAGSTPAGSASAELSAVQREQRENVLNAIQLEQWRNQSGTRQSP